MIKTFKFFHYRNKISVHLRQEPINKSFRDKILDHGEFYDMLIHPISLNLWKQKF